MLTASLIGNKSNIKVSLLYPFQWVVSCILLPLVLSSQTVPWTVEPVSVPVLAVAWVGPGLPPDLVLLARSAHPRLQYQHHALIWLSSELVSPSTSLSADTANEQKCHKINTFHWSELTYTTRIMAIYMDVTSKGFTKLSPIPTVMPSSIVMTTGVAAVDIGTPCWFVTIVITLCKHQPQWLSTTSASIAIVRIQNLECQRSTLVRHKFWHSESDSKDRVEYKLPASHMQPCLRYCKHQEAYTVHGF